MTEPREWDRRPEESEPAWEAFETYRNLGTGRNVREVAQQLSKSLALISRWSKGHNWVSRCAAWEAYLDQQWQNELTQNERQTVKKLLDSAELMRARAHDAILRAEDIAPQLAAFAVDHDVAGVAGCGAYECAAPSGVGDGLFDGPFRAGAGFTEASAG